MTTRRTFLKQAGMGLAALTLGSWVRGEPQKENRPNFIFYITDDISPDDLGCYGNTFVKTPHLDKMAAEGLVFDNAYLTTSSCSPSRCSFITGRYPHNHGAPELATPLPIDQFVFPQSLRQAGYYTALAGKNHMGEVSRAFDFILNHGKGPGFQESWIEIMRQRPKDKPFFFWFGSYDAHRPFTIDDTAPVYDPDDIRPKPFLYDGPETRQDLAGYFHEVSRTDHYLGQIREELARQGVADNTWIIYCSDNGQPFPRSKTRLYDSGIKTPLIVCGPGPIKPARTASLVSSIDVAPTVLELAGVDGDPRIQGVSFAVLLKDPKAAVRDYVFAERNWHANLSHERMVRWQNWLYIRNARPKLSEERYLVSADGYPAARELWEQQDLGRLHPHQQNMFLKPRPAEELFDVQADPDQFTNLVKSKSKYHKEVLAHLRQMLDLWIEQTGDTLPKNPTGDTIHLDTKENREEILKKYAEQLLSGLKTKRGTFPGAEKNAEKINHPGPIRMVMNK